MSADFTPILNPIERATPFRFWCQKVLPLVYDDSLSYYELLCKVVDYLNHTMEDVNQLAGDVENLHTAYAQLQKYVNDYFDNLDVQEEINQKLDEMSEDGTLTSLISPLLPDIVTEWLEQHVEPVTPVVDSSLTISGAAADAKITGDNIRNIITKDEQNEYGLAQMFSRNLLNPDEYEAGYYQHNNPTGEIGEGGNAVHAPRFRILKGLTYSFRSVYGYFSTIIYDDGTVSGLTNDSSISTNVTITADKNGYAYVTVNETLVNSAMVIESYAPYNGTYFVGYDTGISVYPRVAIDPSNYANELPNLAAARKNTVYKIISTTAMTVNGTMTDVPSDLKKGQRSSVLITVGDTRATGTSQILFVPETGEVYTRTLVETEQVQNWTEWLSSANALANSIISNNERTEFDFAQMFSRNMLNPDDYESGYYQHNNPTGVIGEGGNAVHAPKFKILKGLTYSFRGVYGYFSTIIYDDGTVSGLTTDTGISTNVTITATKNGYAYVTVNETLVNSAMAIESYAPYNGTYFVGYDTGMVVYPRVAIDPYNYANELPNLAAARKNTVYKIISTTAMTVNGTMTDVPSDLKKGQRSSVLITVGDTKATGTSQILFVPETGEVYTRTLVETASHVQYWTAWVSVANKEIVVAKDGSGDYTSLTEAMVKAISIPNYHVYVKEGTYDIIAEYEALYGSDFFTNYSQSTAATNPGIRLANNVTLEFAPNAYVVCNYQGSNSAVQNLFTPFNAGTNGFTLINANVTSRNVRYAMHDERASSTEYYVNKYIGCHFNHDKGTGTGYIQAIGGGLGKNGRIEIDNCIFENPSNTGNIVSWHNCVLSGARSNIFIRNSMIKGSVRFSYYGTSTLKSTMMVTGCKMFTEPVKTQETSSYNTDNVEILSWGNTVGTF